MAGHGGGAWKVAYADFVTAMMAFFMVMWITGQSKEVKSAVAQYFNDPLGVAINDPNAPHAAPMGGGKSDSKSPGRGEADSGTKSASGEDPEGDAAGKGKVFVLHDGSHSRIGTVVQFPEGTAELDGEAQARIRQLVPSLLGKPHKVEVRGHASPRPLPPGSNFSSPWDLSFARCQAAMALLEQEGVEPARMRLSQASIFEPQTIKEEADLQAANARVEIYLLEEVAEELVGTREERARRYDAPVDSGPAPPKSPAPGGASKHAPPAGHKPAVKSGHSAH